jgi:4-amino-4-deoxy-L-arabinose transferase-like glycosyltransferase
LTGLQVSSQAKTQISAKVTEGRILTTKYRMKFLRVCGLFGLIALVGAGLLLTVAYSLRTEQRIAVGELGDVPFISGFNQDEAGAPRYRWTGSNRLNSSEATGVINFPLKPIGKSTLELQLGTANNKAVQVTVLANGTELGKVSPSVGQVSTYRFEILPDTANSADSLKVEIRSPVFTPGNGDTRALGVKVQDVRLLTNPGLRFPPLDLWLWAALYVLSLSLATYRLIQRPESRVQSPELEESRSTQHSALSTQHSALSTQSLIALGLAFVLILPLLLLPYVTPRNLNLWYGPYLLPYGAVVALLVALFVWREETTAGLWQFPARLEKGKLARNILLVATLIYVVYAFSIISRMDFVGHADYADNAVVARNLVQGRGLASDYAAQFYVKYPVLPRPADTWPPLQPVLIAPFFAVLGVSAFAAKLPNLLLMIALVWSIFYYGSRLFNKRTALGTALLCLGAPALFETVAYPINDLSFTLFTWLSLCTVYRAANFRPVMGGASTAETTGSQNNLEEHKKPVSIIQRGWCWLSSPVQRPWLLAGLWAGLLFLSKPSGGVLLATAGLWLLFQKFSNRQLLIPWRGLFLWGGIAVLIISPLAIRNLLEFHSPFYSTEQKDAWLLKYYPPDERIYDLYYTDPAKPLPAPNQLLLYGFDTVFKAIGSQFTKEWNDLLTGDFIAPLFWFLSGLGLLVLPRRKTSLVGLIGAVFVVYVLFINLYWHYEIRYFMAWLPWFYAFGLYGLSWIYDKMAAEQPASEKENGNSKPVTSRRKGRFAAWVIAAVFLVLWLPGVQKIVDDGPDYTSGTGIVAVANWLKQNTPDTARVMSRNIWELSFHSQRQGIMIPNNASLDEIKRVMHDYNVRYLELDHTNLAGNQPEWFVWNSRRALWPLITDYKKLGPNDHINGFKKIYEDQHGFVVYELNES